MGSNTATIALLAWYEAMGVDEAVGDAPLNCFLLPAETEPQAQASVAGRARAPTQRRPGFALAAGHREAQMATESAAGEATTLAELEALVGAFDGCPLKRTAKSLCFARGSETARVMLIGEAPGRDEDLQGKPFVGRAGQLLDRMLAAIGLSEEQVYITNTVYWRPPGNRTPSPQEIEACAPFLARQIELLAPKILVLLGGAAAKHILRVPQGIMRLRGKWLSYPCATGDIPTLATLHPAYLLRKPGEKRYAWRDMLMLREALER